MTNLAQLISRDGSSFFTSSDPDARSEVTNSSFHLPMSFCIGFCRTGTTSTIAAATLFMQSDEVVGNPYAVHFVGQLLPLYQLFNAELKATVEN